MRLEPPDPYESEGECIVLCRGLGHERSPRFAVIEADDSGTHALANSLHSRGWAEVGASAAGKTHLLLGDDKHLDAILVVARAQSPDVVAVRQRDTSTLRAWPGWDDDVVGLGYVACLFTGSWRIYVSFAVVDELGPRLSFAAMPDELVVSANLAREGLIEEVVRWRTAALNRWADSTPSVRASTNSAAKREADRLRSIISETHETLSWRITRPLRAVQTQRLRAAQNRRRRGAQN